MIIGAIFFAFVAACAVVMFAAIVKSAVDDSRAYGFMSQPAPAATVVLPGDREVRFERKPERTGRFDRDRHRDRQGETIYR